MKPLTNDEKFSTQIQGVLPYHRKMLVDGVRNKLLYDKTKKLAFDGLRLAQDYLATDGNNFVSNYNEWQCIGGFSSFMQLNVQKTNHRALVGHVSESINLLESYKDALNEMNKDNIWNRHNDQIIGTFMGDQRFKFGDLINYTISSELAIFYRYLKKIRLILRTRHTVYWQEDCFPECGK